jgi:hypothetical protein
MQSARPQGYSAGGPLTKIQKDPKTGVCELRRAPRKHSQQPQRSCSFVATVHCTERTKIAVRSNTNLPAIRSRLLGGSSFLDPSATIGTPDCRRPRPIHGTCWSASTLFLPKTAFALPRLAYETPTIDTHIKEGEKERYHERSFGRFGMGQLER